MTTVLLNMFVCVCVNPLQQLESLVWERSGNLFVSSHNDGGYSVWPVTSGNTCVNQPVSSTIPYGEKHDPGVGVGVGGGVQCLTKER